MARLQPENQFDTAISNEELRSRGWTSPLILRYLGDEDRRDSVAHSANFAGKKMYLLSRVEKAESLPTFLEDFLKSAHRRRLSKKQINEMQKRYERQTR